MSRRSKTNILAQRRRRIRKEVKERVAYIRAKTAAASAPEPTEVGLAEKTAGDLRLLARSLGLKGYSRWTKERLVQEVHNAQIEASRATHTHGKVTE